MTASFDGILRIYKVTLNEQNEQNKASDLLLEVDFKEPILQIESGLLLASNNVQLAVLHPTKFCVYSVSCNIYVPILNFLFFYCNNKKIIYILSNYLATSGAAEHGISYNILLIYEHFFDLKAVNILIRSFGQIKGCNFFFFNDYNFNFVIYIIMFLLCMLLSA